MIPVKIYDNPDTASNNPVADLKNAENVSYEKRINRAGKASFTLPSDDPHVDDIDLLDYAEIYDGDKRVGLYRIRKKRPTKANDRQEIQYECRHVLDTLNQGRIVDKVTRTGVSTALSYILSQQQTAHWQLGTVDFTKTFTYEFQQQSLLNALLSVPQVWWDDYEFTYDTTSYPWTLNLVRPNTTPQAALYYDKNIKTIEKEISTDELVTELYALGDGSGDDRVKVGPLTSNTGTYGYHTKIWEESHYDNATDLQTAAQKYLNKQDTPRISYSGGADDFYRIMEGSNNKLKLGDYVRVYDPDLSFDASVRIVKLKKNDMTGEPASLSFELDNQRRLVPKFGALAREDKVTEDNINSGSVGGGGIASGGVGSTNIAGEAVTWSKIDTGLKTDDGEKIEQTRLLIDAAVTFDSGYNPTEKLPENATAVDSAKIQGETLIQGGYIKTVYLDIQYVDINDTLDISDATLVTSSVNEGGADQTSGHVFINDINAVTSATTQYVLGSAGLFTDSGSAYGVGAVGTDSVLDDILISTTKDGDGHVTSVDVTTSSTTVISSVGKASINYLTDANLVTDDDPVVGSAGYEKVSVVTVS